MKIYSQLLLCTFLLSLYGCAGEDKKTDASIENSDTTEKLFEYLNSDYTGISFSNNLNESEQFNFLLYEYLYNGGGVALGDINNDGLIDIYFSGNTVSNKLYLNLGDFKFKDITESAGVNGGSGFKTGVSMVDINNDGLLDIYVCKSAVNEVDFRRNALYINNGDLTFTESAALYGLDDPGYSVQAYFFDMDGDNDLDVYILNHSGNMRESNSIRLTQNKDGNLELAKPQSYDYISDRLYVNNGNKFDDISKSAGILNDAFGLSAVVSDFNNDGKPDIYVCNDYTMPDRLLINQGNNTFKDQIHDYFFHTSFSSMGSDYADVNNDGHLDLMTLDMLAKDNYRRKMLGMAQNYDKYEKMITYDLGHQYSTNALQINSGAGNYSNIAFLNDVALTDWSWSVLLADFDNDGFKDIHITNGYYRDVTNNDYSKFKMDELQKKLINKEIGLLDWIQEIPSVATPSYFFKNNGDLTFTNTSKSWDSGFNAFSNGSAYADLNNDGFIDVIVNNLNAAPFIMKNNGASSIKNSYLSIEFEHQKSVLNIGTTAKVHLSDGSIITEQLNPTRGFLSSSQHRLHFGVESGKKVEKVEIFWPDKTMQIIQKPELNQLLKVKKSNTVKQVHEKSKDTYFIDASSKLPTQVTHKENAYIDFKREPLLHHKYSEEGPAASVGDINGDGLDDMFLGGATGYEGQLFIQNTNGTFTPKKILAFENDKIFEDVSSLFFDANNDGFLDLYVVSGGNEQLANHQNYQDRLYINDGNGNFTRDITALPQFLSSGGVVRANDIDNDGYLDLFIGGRVTPGRYPETPQSYILKNNKGKFTDVTKQWSESLATIGMVTDAKFADIDKDGINELIVCGEWMPITVFKFSNGTYKNISENLGLSDHKGWWYSLLVEDLNNDGFPEIIAGNLGLNSIIKANPKEPASIYYKDFDKNGSLDAILCFYSDGVSYPLANRDRLLDQMIMLRKRFTRYEHYANATINDLFTPEEMEGVNILEANVFSHSLFVNSNGKSFNRKDLPLLSQISTVNAIQAIDVDNDGHKDLVLGGNFYGTDAQLGRYDASIGTLLLGDGKFNFKTIPTAESGLMISGNVQHIEPIIINNEKYYLIVRNNDKSSLIKTVNSF